MSYDSRGDRTSMVADGVTTNYTYDKNNRLLHIDTNGAMVDYNYDNNGNLYSKLYSSITPATGEAEGVSADLLQQPQLSAMNLTMEEQPLTVEELSAIMEQEPGKSVKEILAEHRRSFTDNSIIFHGLRHPYAKLKLKNNQYSFVKVDDS